MREMWAINIVGIASLIALPFFLPFYIYAQDECPTGYVPIKTAEDRKNATSAGIPTSSKCWQPNDPHIGMNASQAKQYLISLPRAGTTASPAHIQKLNDTFAVCAAQYFKAYIAKYGSVRITSAYRDGASGENKRVGGVPGSNHTRGMAIDVHPNNGNYDSMMNFAKSNPKFGVCFPRPTYRNRPDLPHMILAGIGGRESAGCAAQNITRPCSGAPITDITTPPPSPNGPPSKAYTQALRDLLESPQQTPQQEPQRIPPGYCLVQTQPILVAPCPQPQTQPAQQTPQQPQQPASALPNQQGITDAYSQTKTGGGETSSDLASRRITTEDPATQQKKDKKTATQQIVEWVSDEEKPNNTETVKVVDITLSGEDTARLKENAVRDGKLPPPTPSQFVRTEQTFTSPDLASVAEEKRATVARYQAFLQNAKTTLTTMRSYLKPFGRPEPGHDDPYHGE